MILGKDMFHEVEEKSDIGGKPEGRNRPAAPEHPGERTDT